jgi:uncharacterized protein YecE (DUF72 family)
VLSKEKSKYWIGTSGWRYDEWRGEFYPDVWPKSRWFEYYAQKFPCVEVNATFYRFFKDTTYQKWYDKAPEHFRYVLKAPRFITHRKYLKDVEKEIESFWKSVMILKEKFGLILLQLAPGMPYELERLRKALLTFGDPKRVAVEFRHIRWITDEVQDLLKETGAIFCNSDSPKFKLTERVTSDTGYIRLHGRMQWYNYEYPKEELKEIAETAKRMGTQNAKDIYIFFNNDVGGFAPKNAQTLMNLLTPEK